MTILLAHSTNLVFTKIPFLLAASPRARADSSEILIWLGVAGAVIAGIVGGLVLANRAAHRRRTNSHPGLFASLCQHHKLDRNCRNLLKALGQAHRVQYSARVFLDPNLFDPKRLPPALRSQKNDILALRQKLFLGQIAPAPSTEPTPVHT